jgi:hypothetical protein
MKCGGRVGIALWALSSSAQAAPRAVVTTEAGVHGCLGSSELAARVDSAFVGAEAPQDDHTLQVSVSRKAGGGLVADIRWIGATRETPRRSLESASDDCRQLDDAVLLVARALWEAESAPRSTPTSAPKELAAPAPAPPAGRFEAPALGIVSGPTRPRDAAPTALRGEAPPAPVLVAVGVSAVLGVLEDAALGLRADLRVPVGRELALRFAATHLSNGRVAEVDGGRAQFRAITARAAACWGVPSAFSLDVCLGVEAGALLPQLTHVGRAEEAPRPLLWPLALVAGRFRLAGPLVAQGAIAAGPTMLRRDYYLLDARGDRRAVLRAAPAVMEAAVSLGVELP